MGRGIGRRSPLRQTAALSACVLLAALVGGGWIFARAPLETARWLASRQFAFAGLEQRDAGGMRYWIGGTGPTVVLVHGFGDEAMTWRAVLPALATRYRVIALDLPGHGESDATGGSIDVTYAGLAGFLDDVSPDEPVALVGNSLGGWLGLRYALEHPERTRHLVLVNNAGLRQDLPRDVLIPETREGMQTKLAYLFAGHAPTMPGFMLDAFVRSHQRPQLAKLFDGLRDEDYLDDRLPDLNVPTDVIWGTGDGFFPLDYAQRLERGLPDATFHWLEGCAHAPQFTCPDLFVEHLDSALRAE